MMGAPVPTPKLSVSCSEGIPRGGWGVGNLGSSRFWGLQEKMGIMGEAGQGHQDRMQRLRRCGC
jgi:hypothetical protein